MLLRSPRLILMLGLLVVAPAPEAKQPPTAQQQLEDLQAKLKESRANRDWRSGLASAKGLKELLNGSPDSLLEVARAQVHAGDLKAAFDELQRFVRMGQSTDLLDTSAEFAQLTKGEGSASIRNGMKANCSPISLAVTAFALSDSDLLAEDVDYDPHSKRFFITSVREKKIIAADDKGTSSDFARAPDNWPMLAIKIDPSAEVVWATEVAMQGFSLAPEADWGRSAVLCYDLKTGKLLRRVEGPNGSALGDMTLTTDGDVIVSDGEGGGVYRLPAKGAALERLDNGDFISPQTPAMYPDGKHIFVPDYARGIGVLEIATKQVRWLSMAERFALNGIDGMYFDRGTLIAVQNGTAPERVVAFSLDTTLTKIQSETIIERATDMLDPTHGVMVGNDFFYIANSGWDITDDHGNLKPGAKASVPRIMRAHFTGEFWGDR
ncbi:MAG: YncE family protein [Terriglobales bacterium]